MKTAICFSGEPRSLQYTHRNLREALKAFGDYDVFAYVPECETSDQVKKYFPEATVRIEPDRHIDDSQIPENHDLKTGSQRYLQQINGWKEVNEMRKKAPTDYDFVVRCRMDIVFNNKIPEASSLKKDRLYIPNFHHFNGVNDRFCIGSSNMIDHYLNVIDDYKADPKRCVHAESFLRDCLKQKSTMIEFIDLRFDRIRPDGTRLNDIGDRNTNKLHYPKSLTANKSFWNFLSF